MVYAFLKRFFGSANERVLKRFTKKVEEINALERAMRALADETLRGKTGEFKVRLQRGETLDDILPEAFAVVREASRRVLDMRPFDVQLIGGLILHRGMISEMKTGEGKTLVATLPAYLNALTEKGVHIVTVNDYLAKRDAEKMGKLYGFLGLSTGCITHELDDSERKAAYACDITYGTNNELGFDYLRDHMKFSLDEIVHRPFSYAIVDEVDSILVDEARTPLIISGPAEDSSDLYDAIDAIIPGLTEADYEKDEKARSVLLTEDGTEKVERLLDEKQLLRTSNLYDATNISLVHHVNQALRAHKLFQRDVDYMVKDDKVIIIDEFTGRMMEGRRYSDGLHQALEAKEKVKIQVENQTLASITFQNYFRLYPKLAGMTGTAMTEATEFSDIYRLEVIEVPTNVPCIRKDYDDEVYRTAREKYDAIIQLIEECQGRKQPVLVGTVSIEKSEYLSKLLKDRKIPHQVLNARYHDQEALIIAQAGYPGAVTIATNMAGRGTDIQLGGNWEMGISLAEESNPGLKEDHVKHQEMVDQMRENVQEASRIVREGGGLYVIGTERHESRRIDNQLRGRAGRQGDPGASKFYLSLEDDLMRIFGSERLDSMLQRLGLKEGEAIIHTWINKAIARAQQKVEARNYDIRKQLLKFDDVMNDQRKVVYEQRREIMNKSDISEMIRETRYDVIEDLVALYTADGATNVDWNIESLHQESQRILALDLPFQQWVDEDDLSPVALRERVMEASDKHMAAKEEQFGAEVVRNAERSLMLQILDQTWKEHLLTLDHLRQGINLRAYGQKDPLNEYKAEAFQAFKTMMSHLKESVTAALSHFDVSPHIHGGFGENSFLSAVQAFLETAAAEEKEKEESAGKPLTKKGSSKEKNKPAIQKKSDTMKKPAPLSGKKKKAESPVQAQSLGRNALCSCGSGLRYKHCHGRIGEGS